MSFSDRITISFLEEDNVQRAFFRLRPLLNFAGPVTPEELSVMPDEGFLRIVPDKNEQANFKERMRTLGHLCLLDLTPYPAEANKIRTNKNYAPEKGEKNQYILYSDAIHPLPETLAYEIAEAASPEEIAAKAASFLTPLGYVRVDGQWYGPLHRAEKEPQESPEAPDEGRIHTVSFPDGKQHVFYWAAEEVPAAEEPLDEEQDGEELHPVQPLKFPEQHVGLEDQAVGAPQPVPIPLRMRDTASSVRAMPAIPAMDSGLLSGTPLYGGISPRMRAARPRNPLHEVVDAQWRAAKYEAPSAQLTQGASLRHVENPLEQFREAAELVWSIPEAQPQVLDALLALPGMQSQLEKAFRTEEPDSLVIQAMRRQLQDLEAERLALLIQLDKVRENKAALREEAFATATKEQAAQLNRLKEEAAQWEASAASLQGQVMELQGRRDALQALLDELVKGEFSAQLSAFAKGHSLFTGEPALPLRLSPAAGKKAAPARMITALKEAFSRECPALTQEDAVHFLLLLALCKKVQIAHPSLSEGVRFTRLCMEALGLAEAFGIQSSPGQPVLLNAPAGSLSPACVATPYLLADVPGDHARTLMMTKSPSAYLNEVSYELDPWPVLVLPELFPGLIPEASACIKDPLPAVSMESLEELAKDGAPLSEEVLEWLEGLHKIMAGAGLPLPLHVVQAMTAYLKAAGQWMQGGIAAAMDYAFEAWIAPQALRSEKLLKSVRPLLAALPRSGKVLK